MTKKEYEGDFWGTNNVLFPDLGVGYTGMFTFVKILAVN